MAPSIRRVRMDRSQAEPSSNPIFTGPVAIQELVNDSQADLLRVTSVTFEKGARNKPHRHSTDQVLIATDGNGFVATDGEVLSLEPGDVALIPKNTRHWHGAQPESTFTHFSILTPGHMEVDADETS